MPLTDFPREVFATLRLHRSPDSFVFRATVLHAARTTPRFSRDIDLCHDAAGAVAETAHLDAASLISAGYKVTWHLQHPTFHRATIQREEHSVKLEWVYDSAWRFYPVEPDPELGYGSTFSMPRRINYWPWLGAPSHVTSSTPSTCTKPT